MNSKADTCSWKLEIKRKSYMSGDERIYATDCGETFMIADGTIKENGVIFCPYCGKKIEIKDEQFIVSLSMSLTNNECNIISGSRITGEFHKRQNGIDFYKAINNIISTCFAENSPFRRKQ